ncbi:MAG: tetratricopeptide repeat protein [Planctomycetes bacterium]|nr:tetratricopeptide repeat protein [Planctomycetota bacterium]
MSQNNLGDDVHNAILALCKKGDELAEDGRLNDAVETYEEAYALLPEPKTDWEASTWILGAIGDMLYQVEQFEDARSALLIAMHCPNAIGNPFLHLRLGQVQYELGDQERAGDELARAYMAEGIEIFSDEDPKYLEFLRTVIDLA